MNLKLISTVGDLPVSLAEAKAQLQYSDTDQDTYITGLINAATGLAEIYNGRLQVLRRWEMALDYWPSGPYTGITAIPNPYFGFWPSDAYRLLAGVRPELNGIALLAPLVSVEALTYRTSDGVTHTLIADTDYIVDTFKEPGIAVPGVNQNWPIVGLWPTSAIRVQFTAGRVPDAAAYATANPTAAPAPEVPATIKQGILLLVTQWFEKRIPFDAIRFVAEVPFSVTALFTSDKLWL